MFDPNKILAIERDDTLTVCRDREFEQKIILRILPENVRLKPDLRFFPQRILQVIDEDFCLEVLFGEDEVRTIF